LIDWLIDWLDKTGGYNFLIGELQASSPFHKNSYDKKIVVSVKLRS
jgi:hypothetical protein